MREGSSFAPTGKLRELLLLFFPILITTFSSCVYLFIEKLLLAKYSVQAMEAAVSAAYACQIFQAPCISIALMAQVFVGRWVAGQEWKNVGPGMWQFIWFAFLSSLFAIPCGILYGKYYFHGMAIQPIVTPYYHFLLYINFLFPLGAALSAFYLGQGKTKVILYSTVSFQILKLICAYLLIFGWEPFIPSQGLMGGAISTMIAQGGLCVFLFFLYLKSTPSTLQTITFRPKLFWECIYPGLLRAINRVLSFVCWAFIARLMSSKGGDYLLNLSIGGTLFIFLPFIGDAVCQAQTTIISHLIGSKQYHLMKKAFQSGTILIFLTIFIVSVPLIIFPIPIYHYLFSTISLDELVVKKIFFGVWTSFAFYTWGFIPLSYVLAYKDTKFTVYMGLGNWLNGFLLMYFFMDILKIPPDQFWLALSLMHATNFICYYWRMKWLWSQSQQFERKTALS